MFLLCFFFRCEGGSVRSEASGFSICDLLIIPFPYSNVVSVRFPFKFAKWGESSGDCLVFFIRRE